MSLAGDLHVERLVRRLGRVLGHEVEVLRRLRPRIFEDAPLVRAVEEVAVGGVGLLERRRHRDVELAAVGDEVGAPLQLPLPPGTDDADARLELVGGDLEADLVVALPGGSVADGVGSLLPGDVHHVLRDDGARQRGAEQVHPLVNGAGPQRREDEVPRELLADVALHVLHRARLLRLGGERGELLPLPQVGTEGDHLGVIVLHQPAKDHAGVEAAGVGEHHLALPLLGGSPRVPASHRGLRSTLGQGFLSSLLARVTRDPLRGGRFHTTDRAKGGGRPRRAGAGFPLQRPEGSAKPARCCTGTGTAGPASTAVRQRTLPPSGARARTTYGRSEEPRRQPVPPAASFTGTEAPGRPNRAS